MNQNKTIISLLLLICISCSKKENNKATFFSGQNKISIQNGAFCISNKGSLYYYIEDENLMDEVCNKKIDSIKFEIGIKEYYAKPINLTFSKTIHNSNFIFPVNNKTKKIIFDTYDNKQMFTLASEKTKIDDLIKTGIIKPILIEE